MKKALLILFVAAASLTSCKKDKEGKLEGRWDVAKVSYTEYENSIKIHESTETPNTGMFYMVFNGNEFVFHKDGEIHDSGTFSATNTSITFTSKFGNVETNPLKWNSKNEFVIFSEYNYTLNGKAYSDKEGWTFKKN